MAFDKQTGAEAWRAIASRTEMGYHQPSIIEAGGARQLIVWHPRGLSSLNPQTGELYWEEEFPGRANMTVADADRYFVYNENGDLIIAQFNPDGYVELDRTHLMNPTSRSGYGGARPGSGSRARHGQSDRLVVWSHPAFANRHLVLRNDEEIIRVSLDQDDY